MMKTHILVGAGIFTLVFLSNGVPTQAADDMSRLAADCNTSLWTHVYNPARLKVANRCIAVRGTVDESSADDDGDQHLLLKLDPGQDQLLKKKNRTKKNGDLVAEIVCVNHVKLKKARAACAGYSNQILPPPVGAHVTVTGTYVIDSHNGWAEIHPVSRVDVIQ